MTDWPGDATVVETTTDPDAVYDQNGTEYKTTGKTVVKAAHGYEYATADKSVPVVTEKGVTMGKQQADAIIAEAAANNASDIVFVADEED